MSKTTTIRWVAAAILVLVAGAVLVAAEERIEVKVEKHDADEVMVDINGESEVIHLDDLAEGESRRFDVGGHELVVTRVGDELTVLTEGHGFGALGGDGDHTMVWVTDDGETVEVEGARSASKVMVVKVGEEAGAEDTTSSYTIRLDGDDVLVDGKHVIDIDEIVMKHEGGEPHAVFITEDGALHHPKLLTTHMLERDLVRYRCDETGSVLLVPADDAIEDVYICPATGCVMQRVEEPEIKVIKIERRIETDDE